MPRNNKINIKQMMKLKEILRKINESEFTRIYDKMTPLEITNHLCRNMIK